MRDLAFVAVLLPLLGLSCVRPFVGLLVWSWLSFMNPHRELYGFAAGQSWAMMSFIATIIGCFVGGEPRRLPLNTATVLLALLAVWVTITSFTAMANPAQVWWKWDRTVKMIAGQLLAACLLTSRERIAAMVWVMVISLGYFGVKGGIFTVMTGGAFEVLGPNYTLIADRNHIAVGLLVALPLMNWLRMHSRHAVVRIVLLAAMGCTLLAVVGTQSRGALVSLVAVGGVLWLRSRGKIISGIVIVLAMAAAITFMPDSWVQRMNTIQTYDEDASAVGRLTIWRVALGLALMRPIIGAGFRAVYEQPIVDLIDPAVKARADHSIWLEVLSEQGFPGLALWLGILLAGLVYSMRITARARGRPDLLWAYDLARMSQVSMAAYVTGGSFLSLAYWDYYWTVIVLQGATLALLGRRVAAAETPQAVGATAADWRSPRSGVIVPR
jgi:probable O-glycosylation ligase (exosortase A-associated)